MDERELVDAFADAASAVGIDVRVPEGSSGPDALNDIVINVHGTTIPVNLKYLHTPSPVDLTRHIEKWQTHAHSADSLFVLVGERIVGGARDLLRSRGWGWLDFRGHLYLTGPGLLVDTTVAPLSPKPKRVGPLDGSAGIEISCSLLLHPERPLIVREIARELNRSPSTVSETLKTLRGEGILTKNGSVMHRDLFWRLAESWRRQSIALAALPKPGRGSENTALQLGLQNVESTTGWALTDTLAATLYRAPVGIRSDYPPDFYVPTERILIRAVKLLGEVKNPAEREATVRVAPTKMACEQRVDAAQRHLGNEIWPLAHPLFVALDLAGDPGRGTEILSEWNPPEPWRRVW